MKEIKGSVSDIELIDSNVNWINELGESLNVAGVKLAQLSALYAEQFEKHGAVWGEGNAFVQIVDSAMLATNLIGSASMLTHIVDCVDRAAKKAIENPNCDTQAVINAAIAELEEENVESDS